MVAVDVVLAGVVSTAQRRKKTTSSSSPPEAVSQAGFAWLLARPA
jgi:hypothetical protein